MSSTLDVLVVAPDPLARSLGSAGGDDFRVAVEAEIDAAIGQLAQRRFDAVVLDARLVEWTTPREVDRVREMADGAALIVSGGDGELLRSIDSLSHEWIGADESPAALSGCVRGAVERRRLREELRRRTEALAESEARFSSIVEHTPDGIVIVGGDRRVWYVNPGAERIFGRSAAELLDEDFGLALSSGETTDMDIVGTGNAQIVAEVRVSDTTWDGEPAQVISLRDVTDRKQAEERERALAREHADREQAEKEAQRFRFLAEAAAKLDASLNPDVTLVNLARLIVPRVADWCVIDLVEGDRIRRVAGVHADEEKQETLEELMRRFPPRPGTPQPATRVLQTGVPELHRHIAADRMRQLAVDDDHVALLTKLGARSSMTVPLEGREGRLGAMNFVCDDRQYDENDLAFAGEIASRAALALENARLYDAALTANRAKSDFLAVMSHELRTPLNAILGYTDLLLAGVSGTMDEQQTAFLDRIRAGATQLLRIIDEILTYSQSEAGRTKARPTSVELGALIQEIVDTAHPMVREKGLAFNVELPRPDVSLFTDAAKLRQVILDLLTNAVKFTETGGIRLVASLDGDELVVRVSDTGIGIEPADLEVIFEPFLQIEQGPTRRAGGTGLGLSVSRELTRLLGGEISVRSTPGEGSEFTVRVPVRLGASEGEGGGGGGGVEQRKLIF